MARKESKPVIEQIIINPPIPPPGIEPKKGFFEKALSKSIESKRKKQEKELEDKEKILRNLEKTLRAKEISLKRIQTVSQSEKEKRVGEEEYLEKLKRRLDHEIRERRSYLQNLEKELLEKEKGLAKRAQEPPDKFQRIIEGLKEKNSQLEAELKSRHGKINEFKKQFLQETFKKFHAKEDALLQFEKELRQKEREARAEAPSKGIPPKAIEKFEAEKKQLIEALKDKDKSFGDYKKTLQEKFSKREQFLINLEKELRQRENELKGVKNVPKKEVSMELVGKLRAREKELADRLRESNERMQRLKKEISEQFSKKYSIRENALLNFEKDLRQREKALSRMGNAAKVIDRLQLQNTELKTALKEREEQFRNSEKDLTQEIFKKSQLKEKEIRGAEEQLSARATELLNREKEIEALAKRMSSKNFDYEKKVSGYQKEISRLSEIKSKAIGELELLNKNRFELQKEVAQLGKNKKFLAGLPEREARVSSKEAELLKRAQELQLKESGLRELEDVNTSLRQLLSRKEEELKHIDGETIEKAKLFEQKLAMISDVEEKLGTDARIVEEKEQSLKKAGELKAQIRMLEREEEKLRRRIAEAEKRISEKEQTISQKERQITSKEKTLKKEIETYHELEEAMLEKAGRESSIAVSPELAKSMPLFGLIEQCRGAIRLNQFEEANEIFNDINEKRAKLKLTVEQKRMVELSVQELYDDLNLAMLYT